MLQRIGLILVLLAGGCSGGGSPSEAERAVKNHVLKAAGTSAAIDFVKWETVTPQEFEAALKARGMDAKKELKEKMPLPGNGPVYWVRVVYREEGQSRDMIFVVQGEAVFGEGNPVGDAWKDQLLKGK